MVIALEQSGLTLEEYARLMVEHGYLRVDRYIIATEEPS